MVVAAEELPHPGRLEFRQELSPQNFVAEVEVEERIARHIDGLLLGLETEGRNVLKEVS